MKMTPKVSTLIMRYTVLFLFVIISSFPVLAQVGSLVEFGQRNSSHEQVVHISWAERDVEEWKRTKQVMLDIMALRTDITSASLPKSEIPSSTFVFVLQKPYFIEMLVEVDWIAEGESLIIEDRLSGKKIFSIDGSMPKKILIPAFNPLTSVLKWIAPAADAYKSRFTIKTLYLHEFPDDRGGSAIGFGTALSCHPNAACKQDSILKLISNSAVRIRMVMEAGIGWCTGSFINNTRNDRTPYLLTAFHCTFDNVPVYELWRFDFEYKSDSCANPASEPLVFSMTGCEKKAGGQASDFLLLLLNSNIPSNHQVTFAGWMRRDTITPDTSYLIHHPNADIRKISTCTNKAVIHPNQIGWSEGYTTPGSHHFRFKFTEGGHQPGASGGPVFNQDGFLIGQLHGGIMGCEVVNNAFIGRFSKSWNLGPISAERLKDWLDPDNRGVTQWQAIQNIAEGDLADIQGVVLDPHGMPVRNVLISISGSVSDTVYTNAEGEFIVNAVNRNGQYHIVPTKDDNQTNGVSVIDLVTLQKHLLGKDTFDLAWQHIAGDATNNQVVSAGDLVVILRLLLGRITFFPSSPSWRIIPPQIDINTIPPGGPFEVQFEAVKIGDVNGSADPGI